MSETTDRIEKLLEAQALLQQRVQLVVEELMILTLLGAAIADRSGYAALYYTAAAASGITDGVLARATWVQGKIGRANIISEEELTKILKSVSETVERSQKNATKRAASNLATKPH